MHPRQGYAGSQQLHEHAGTLRFEDRNPPVERRGGQRWTGGCSNPNDDALLATNLNGDGEPTELQFRITDGLSACGSRVATIRLRVVPFGASDDDDKEVETFLPCPQAASGGSGRYKVNAQQQLLRLDFTINPRICRQGEKRVQVRLGYAPEDTRVGQIGLQKLEMHARFIEAP
jgi:hypothetical protein